MTGGPAALYEASARYYPEKRSTGSDGPAKTEKKKKRIDPIPIAKDSKKTHTVCHAYWRKNTERNEAPHPSC